MAASAEAFFAQTYQYHLEAGVYASTELDEAKIWKAREVIIYRSLPVQAVSTEDSDAISETKRWRGIVASRRQIKNKGLGRHLNKIKEIQFEVDETILRMADLAALAKASEGIAVKRSRTVTAYCDAWEYTLDNLKIYYSEMGKDCGSSNFPSGYKLAFVPEKSDFHIVEEFRFFLDSITTYEMVEQGEGNGRIKVSYVSRGQYGSVAPNTMETVGDFGYIERNGEKSKIIYAMKTGSDSRLGSKWLDGLYLFSENGYRIELAFVGPSGAKVIGANVRRLTPSAAQRIVESIRTGRRFDINFQDWTYDMITFYMKYENEVPLNDIQF